MRIHELASALLVLELEVKVFSVGIRVIVCRDSNLEDDIVASREATG